MKTTKYFTKSKAFNLDLYESTLEYNKSVHISDDEIAYDLATRCYTSGFDFDVESYDLLCKIKNIFGNHIANKIIKNLFTGNHDTRNHDTWNYEQISQLKEIQIIGF